LTVELNEIIEENNLNNFSILVEYDKLEFLNDLLYLAWREAKLQVPSLIHFLQVHLCQ
jgi:hypothetical protein